MVDAVTPLTMVSLRLILKASSASDVLLVGASTMPSVALVDVSGFRSGLPPLIVVNCVEQSVRLPVTGQRIGTLVPAGVTSLVTGRYGSCRLGARTPLPTAPRSSTSDNGCQRTLTFGVVEFPTFW